MGLNDTYPKCVRPDATERRTATSRPLRTGHGSFSNDQEAEAAIMASAMYKSCRAMPELSNIVISSGVRRPLVASVRTVPIADIGISASACWNSPIRADCSGRSQNNRLRAKSSGGSSCLPVASGPVTELYRFKSQFCLRFLYDQHLAA